MFENLTKGFSTEGISSSVNGITSNFYYMVVIIAIIILILLLTYIGILMKKKSNNKQEFPPVQNSCPDYWGVDSSNPKKCIVPANGGKNTGDAYSYSNNVTRLTATGRGKTHGLETRLNGTNTDPVSIDFSNSGWARTGVSETCAKKRWANVHGILWDGVANYNRC
jgi:hypothetical protein